MRWSLGFGASGGRAISVLIVDDDGRSRVGLRTILSSEADIEVVGEAAIGADARRQCLQLRPDVVLMAVPLPGADGITATSRIADDGGTVPKVIVLTVFGFEEYMHRSLAAGASGYLLKRDRADDVIATVRAVAAEHALPAREMTRRPSANVVRRGPRGTAALVGTLTRREADVLVLVARGLSNQEIAAHLGLSVETIRTHVKHVYVKLGVSDRARAVIVAYESGLVGRAS
jgi:DNA-binding NarL/FixJ family response regulator